MRYSILMCVWLTAACVQAQQPSIIDRLNDLEKQSKNIDALRKDVDDLKSRVDALDGKAKTAPPATARPTTYTEAWRLSVKTGKPFVVWVGSAICPGCIATTHDEFVHWTTPSFPNAQPAALLVGLPDGNGGMTTLNEITAWPAGHLTTIRSAIADFRAGRATARAERQESRQASSYASMQVRSYAASSSRRGACGPGG